MRMANKALILGSICLLASVNGKGDPAAGFESLMTPEQYRSYGLQKLNEDERKALFQWLQHYAANPIKPLPAVTVGAATTATAIDKSAADQAESITAAVAAPSGSTADAGTARATPVVDEANFGFPAPLPDTSEDSYKLHARVVGKFKGWSGKTTFALDNGQVWRQRSSGRYTYSGDDTRVVISQNRWGFYELRLVAADRSVGVSRVK